MTNANYNLVGIFEDNYGDYYWMDGLDDDEIKQAKYFMYDGCADRYHASHKSALYDDLTGYVDELQNENESLCGSELYVVIYFEFDWCISSLNQKVDFGVTKQEIIDNVKAQKYLEGASYFTMGHMFYATRTMMEETEKESDKFDYYEVEFGVLKDGAQTSGYDADYSNCIKAKHWPSISEVERWLKGTMDSYGCDCVHSITKISEQEALDGFGNPIGEFE